MKPNGRRPHPDDEQLILIEVIDADTQVFDAGPAHAAGLPDRRSHPSRSYPRWLAPTAALVAAFDGSIMPSFYRSTEGYIRPGDAFTGKAGTDLSPLLTAQQVEDVVSYLMTLTE